MTLSVTSKTITLSNGQANDAAQVESCHVDLYDNDATIAAYVNAQGRLGTGYRGSAPPVWASNTTITMDHLVERDSTDTIDIIQTTPMTLNAATNAAVNALDTGSLANNTFYYLYGICKADGTSAGLLLSTTNESASGTITLPTSYTKKRQLPFWTMTDGSAHLLPFMVGTGWPYQPYIFYTGRKDTLSNGVSVTTGTSQFLVVNAATTGSYVQYNVTALPTICERGIFHFLIFTSGFSGFILNTTGVLTDPNFAIQSGAIQDQVREVTLGSGPSIWVNRQNGSGSLYADLIGGVVTGVN